MSWCRPGAMVLGECGDATVKLLWFSCCRLRLVPHGVAAELRGNRFSTEAGLLLGAGSGPPGWLVGGVERHTVRGRFGSCRGGCGFGERSHRTRSARNLPRRPRRRSRGAAYRSEQHVQACSDITLVDPGVVETIGPGQTWPLRTRRHERTPPSAPGGSVRITSPLP